MRARNAFSARWPSRRLLDTIGDKWTSLAIAALGVEGPLPYPELSRRIEGVSQKMPVRTARGLERGGPVLRAATPSVPVRTDYELALGGQSLLAPICHLKAWAEEHLPEVDAARAAYDAR